MLEWDLGCISWYTQWWIKRQCVVLVWYDSILCHMRYDMIRAMRCDVMHSSNCFIPGYRLDVTKVCQNLNWLWRHAFTCA